MARIWYSVCGEGLGHATRSDIVIQHLLHERTGKENSKGKERAKHEIIITAYGKAYDYLKPRYKHRVHKIAGNNYVYEDNTIRVRKSIAWLLLKTPWYAVHDFSLLLKIIRPWKPDVLITDFESASAYYALFAGIPVINLDNIHVLKECATRFPVSWTIRAGIKILQPKGDYYIIPAIRGVTANDPQTTFVVPPLVGDDVQRLTPRDDGHVLVYQTSQTHEALLPLLAQEKRRFIVYGVRGQKNYKNIIFKPTDRATFIKDLASAHYVIMNGGFTLLSESLYMKKPILAIPVKKQIEQEFNAWTLDHLGYGASMVLLRQHTIKTFEQHLTTYQRNLRKLPSWDNQELFKTVTMAIERCMRKE
jgi:uncharacterized protein (TIGR00661 family)